MDLDIDFASDRLAMTWTRRVLGNILKNPILHATNHHFVHNQGEYLFRQCVLHLCEASCSVRFARMLITCVPDEISAESDVKVLIPFPRMHSPFKTNPHPKAVSQTTHTLHVDFRGEKEKPTLQAFREFMNGLQHTLTLLAKESMPGAIVGPLIKPSVNKTSKKEYPDRILLKFEEGSVVFEGEEWAPIPPGTTDFRRKDVEPTT